MNSFLIVLKVTLVDCTIEFLIEWKGFNTFLLLETSNVEWMTTRASLLGVFIAFSLPFWRNHSFKTFWNKIFLSFSKSLIDFIIFLFVKFQVTSKVLNILFKHVSSPDLYKKVPARKFSKQRSLNNHEAKSMTVVSYEEFTQQFQSTNSILTQKDSHKVPVTHLKPTKQFHKLFIAS